MRYSVEFDPQASQMGFDPEAERPNVPYGSDVHVLGYVEFKIRKRWGKTQLYGRPFVPRDTVAAAT